MAPAPKQAGARFAARIGSIAEAKEEGASLRRLGGEKDNMPNLKILFKGDKFLVNTYHTLCQIEGATPGRRWAAEFIDFVSSEEGQKIVQDFGKEQYGQGLYDDAAYAKRYDD
jgi:ABC-type tungstate transport system permease subunit